MKQTTEPQIKLDLKATQADIRRLTAIVQNMGDFIAFPHDEDRSRFKMDLMKWETFLDVARRLEAAIKRALDERKERIAP